MEKTNNELFFRTEWLKKFRFVFQSVCEYLGLKELLRLALTSKILYYLFIKEGFKYKNLSIYQHNRFHIPLKLSRYLVPLEPCLSKSVSLRTLPSYKICPTSIQRTYETNIKRILENSTPQLLTSQNTSIDHTRINGDSVFSPTEYSTHTGTFRRLTHARKQRLRRDGTSSETIGDEWFRCSKLQQREWLSKITGLERLWVDVDIMGDKGIEPSSLAQLLINNFATLTSIKIYWGTHPHQIKHASIKKLVDIWWMTNIREESQVDKISLYAFENPESILVKTDSEKTTNNINKKNFNYFILNKEPIVIKDNNIEKIWEVQKTENSECSRKNSDTDENIRSISRAHVELISTDCDSSVSENIVISSLHSEINNQSSKSLEKKSDFTSINSNNPNNIFKSDNSIIQSFSSHSYLSDRDEKVNKNLLFENNSENNPAFIMTDKSNNESKIEDKNDNIFRLVFPNAKEVTIQLAHQFAVEFFQSCRFPNCEKFLVEEMNPLYNNQSKVAKKKKLGYSKPALTKTQNNIMVNTNSFSQTQNKIRTLKEKLRQENQVRCRKNNSDLKLQFDNQETDEKISLTNDNKINKKPSSYITPKSDDMISFLLNNNEPTYYDGRHLRLWLSVIRSMKHLKEAHILLGRIFNKDSSITLENTSSDELHNIISSIFKQNRKTLEVFSCRSAKIASQELLLVVAEWNASCLLLKDANKLKKHSSYFNNFLEIDCEETPIILSEFALNVLLYLPKVHWNVRYVIISSKTETQKPLTPRHLFLKDLGFTAEISRLKILTDVRVFLDAPKGFFRPENEYECAILERWLLRLLEVSLEKLAVEQVSQEMSLTFEHFGRLKSTSYTNKQTNAANALYVRIFKSISNPKTYRYEKNSYFSRISHLKDLSLWYDMTIKNSKNTVSLSGGVLGFASSYIKNIPESDVTIDLIQALIEPVQEFPSVTQLHIKWLNNRNNGCLSNVEQKYLINFLRGCRLGTTGKLQNPFARSKSRLKLSIIGDCPSDVIAVLPKFQLELQENFRTLGTIIKNPAARKQLRGLSGSIESLIRGLTIIQRESLPWTRPHIKLIEVFLACAVARRFASVLHFMKPISHFRHISEIRVFPKVLPQFLTPEEVFAENSPEGDVLRDILRDDGFHRDRVAEAEIRGLYGTSMFVFTRPRGKQSRWKKLSMFSSPKNKLLLPQVDD